MATDFVSKLDGLVTASNGDWRKFIRMLGPVHASWHSEHNAGTAMLGFLLFHWELVARFKAVGADHGLGGLGGIFSYTEPQLANYGASYTVPEHAAAGDTSSFEVFSGDLEAWHNDAHMEIGMAVHHNLMNPRTNVRRPEFWRLHYFINDRFVDELHNYAAGAAPATTVATLEKNKSVAAAI